MTATFTGYAAVAIQNARLFSEAQEQAWVATMLVQVAEATQSVLSVDDLLATMLRLTRLLVGVRKCAFLLHLENQPFYELKAWYGFEPGSSGPLFIPGGDARPGANGRKSRLDLLDRPVDGIGVCRKLPSQMGRRCRLCSP